VGKRQNRLIRIENITLPGDKNYERFSLTKNEYGRKLHNYINENLYQWIEMQKSLEISCTK